MKTKQELKQYFENGDIPVQEEFWEWQESYWHKDENIPQDNILGLKETIKTKLNAPDPNLSSGFYFIAHNSPWTTYQKINLNSYYLTSWNGSNFVSSNIFYNNEKVGIGTQAPTEILQVEGNIKTKGLIISELDYIPPMPGQTKKFVVARQDGSLGWDTQSNDSQNHIPLSGTDQGSPITGDLTLDNINGNKEIKGTVQGSYISFNDDGSLEINNKINTSINVTISGIDFLGTQQGFGGIAGSHYYGDMYLENSFIQKKYADKQHSYTTKEELTGGTWINGKPVYKKTVVFNQIPRTGLVEFKTEFPDIETIISNEMFTEWQAIDAAFAGNQWRNKACITIERKLATIELIGDPNYDYSAINSFTLTLEYTKK